MILLALREFKKVKKRCLTVNLQGTAPNSNIQNAEKELLSFSLYQHFLSLCNLQLSNQILKPKPKTCVIYSLQIKYQNQK